MGEADVPFPDIEGAGGGRWDRLGPQRTAGGVQMQRVPVGVGWRPAGGVPDGGDGVGVVPDLDPDGRSVQDRGVVTAQEMVEEFGLDQESGRGIVGAPFGPAMRVQPFLLRTDTPEALEGSAGVHVVVGKAAADQRGHLDILDRPVPRSPPVVEFGPAAGLCDNVDPMVGGDAQSDPEHDQEAVLPDPTRPGAIPVEVGEALPRRDRGQMRRSGRRGGPLGHRQVRHPGHPHAPVAPRLDGRPFDQVVAVQAFLFGEDLRDAVGFAPAAQVGVDDDIPTVNPVRRIGRLPPGPGRMSHRAGLHQVVLHRRAVAGPEPAPTGQGVLAVGVHAQQDRVLFVVVRAKHVDPQPDTVAHRYCDIPVHAGAGRRVGDRHGHPDAAPELTPGVSHRCRHAGQPG